MIRIAYIINNLPVGGAETLLLNFIKCLDRQRYKPYIYVLFKSNPLKHEYVKAGATIRELQLTSNRRIWRIHELARLLREDKISIAHTHLCDADLYGRVASRIAGIRTIISTQHSVDPWKFKKDLKKRLRSTLDLLTSKLCSAVICNSEAVATFHIRWGIPRNKILVIYPSAPMVYVRETIRAARRRLALPLNDFLVVAVGRLAPEKGQGILLQAAFDILRENSHISFVFVGDGPLRQEMQTTVRYSGYERKIFFLGIRRDVARILHASNLFVMPSIYEGFGVTIIEAMQQSLPIVATNVGGIPEIVDKTNGILVPPLDKKALVNAILRLRNDKTLRMKLGHSGKEKADIKFSFNYYVERSLLLYRTLFEKDYRQ